MESIRTVFERFLTFGDGATDAVIVNNADWLESLNYIDFLRDYGKYFSVNRMLTQDSAKLRLEREQNLSFLEFNYMIFQAYDFVELHRRHHCQLQIGGSDQWGNIIMGIDLHHRLESERRFQPMPLPGGSVQMKVLEVQPVIQSKRTDAADYTPEAFLQHLQQDESHSLYGLTTPLVTTAGGAKMGKTATGAVWLDRDMLSPYDYWQYWRNTADADVGRFLRLFTELPLKQIVELESLKGADINEAKKILAHEATKLCHSERAARTAAETAKKTFEEGGVGADIPVFKITANEFGKGVPAYELFRLCGLSDSGGEARRLIRGGGARLGDRKIMDENELIGPELFNEKQELKISSGRKKHMVVKLS